MTRCPLTEDAFCAFAELYFSTSMRGGTGILFPRIAKYRQFCPSLCYRSSKSHTDCVYVLPSAAPKAVVRSMSLRPSMRRLSKPLGAKKKLRFSPSRFLAMCARMHLLFRSPAAGWRRLLFRIRRRASRTTSTGTTVCPTYCGQSFA